MPKKAKAKAGASGDDVIEQTLSGTQKVILLSEDHRDAEGDAALGPALLTTFVKSSEGKLAAADVGFSDWGRVPECKAR